ncbi:MAG: hypothetical protein AAFO04_13645 [Cyanobacteria bacterium J06592_8]
MKTSKHCSVTPEATLQKEDESLEVSQTIMTLGVILFMGISTALSMVLGNSTSQNLVEVETQSLNH